MSKPDYARLSRGLKTEFSLDNVEYIKGGLKT